MVHVAGDIDLSSQDGLRVALRGGLAAAPRHLVLDLSDVQFCGARALTVLAGAPCGAAGGTTCAVSGLSPVMDRLARCLWDASAPTRYPSLSHALAGIRAA
ncbi:anti-anti-sigma factor [Pseudonocardia sediminis]|uniref:Anti-anti-sigma factor n=1 Tax=Pseudonocardia sediminis TaxID=1397368 RepID=A0A4Q7UYB3_PSEST|nr:anti-anti-sigma factor [Pseudonocardia sediminis]